MVRRREKFADDLEERWLCSWLKDASHLHRLQHVHNSGQKRNAKCLLARGNPSPFSFIVPVRWKNALLKDLVCELRDIEVCGATLNKFSVITPCILIRRAVSSCLDDQPLRCKRRNLFGN